MTSEQRKLPLWMSAVKERELQSNNSMDSFLKKNILEDDLPFFKFNGSIVYSYEANDCSLLSELIRTELAEEAVLGFDIEWPALFTKGKNGKVALIQLCVSERKCYLFHVSAMSGFPKGLKRLLENESVRKVGVGIEGDQWKLMSDCDIKLKGFIELADLANQKLKCTERWSLNGLVKHLFKKQLLKDKSVRCSKWDICPLTEEQKFYAAADAYAGLQIYEKLENMDEQEKVLLCLVKGKTIEPSEVRQQLISLSEQIHNLAENLPNSFDNCNDVQRAVDILDDLSEQVEELGKMMLESSKEHHPVSECIKPNKITIERLEPVNVSGEVSTGNKEDTSRPKASGEQDFFNTLGISEEELYMIEQECIEEQNCRADKSEEYLDEFDNSEERNLELQTLQKDEILSKDTVTVIDDEDDDEGIEEEDEDDWDPSLPGPTIDQISCLKTYFGHSSFKPVQWKVIHSVLKERRDNLVVMATGYGKSLCYQFAPVFTCGIGIVICPLISLMEDQVLQLEMSNIPSCFLGSAQSKNVMHDVKAGKFKVIYMTPEFCSSGMSLLQDLDDKYGLTLIAIDEAHCISEWGHDFRNAYRNLGTIKRSLPAVPIVALTATASPSIREDITKSLGLRNPQITCTSFDRPNLYLDVGRKTSNVSRDLQQFLLKKQGSYGWEFEGATIVYCPSRKTSELVTAELHSLGIKCGTYHAGMAIRARREIHHQFMRDEIQCVVATVAFGMGINKPDIRKVIHYGAPKEMESYYQEIGRAGRDGLPSCCHALWAPSDMNFNRHMLSEIKNQHFRQYKLKMLGKMEKYLNSNSCRRKIILSHFEDKQLRKVTYGIMGTEKCCDNCKTRLVLNLTVSDVEENLQDFGVVAYKLMSAVEALGERFGTGVPVLFLRGSNSQRLPDRHRRHPLFGQGKDQTETFWKALARQLIVEGFLQEISGHNKFATTCGLTLKGRNWITEAASQSSPRLLLPPNEELCSRRVILYSNQQAVSPSVSQPSKGASSSKTVVVFQTTLKDKYSHQEAEKLPRTPQVSKSSVRLQSPVKPSKPTEPPVSPRALKLQTSLYGKLVAARQKIASEKDIPPAVLATNKVLVDMAKLRPTTTENMKKVDGVSEAKASMLAPLVEVVSQFCLEHNLQSDTFSVPSTALEAIVVVQKGTLPISLPESQRVTYSMFHEQHLSMQTIADARSLSMAAVGMHLCQALKAGYPVNVQRAGLTPTIQKTIMDILKNPPINSDLSSFKAIRDLVPSNIDIYLIRMVMAILEKEGFGEAKNPNSAPHMLTVKPSTCSPENTKQKVYPDNSSWLEIKKTAVKCQPSIQDPEVERPEEQKAKQQAPIKLASWNQPLDADTEELFAESQLQVKKTYLTIPIFKMSCFIIFFFFCFGSNCDGFACNVNFCRLVERLQRGNYLGGLKHANKILCRQMQARKLKREERKDFLAD
uniref:DNA 3'-5' helicase n=1 Tax=Leptobrachium leishanense TaxID=445787 RepID=A0A8C5MVB8_9ANUR